MSFKIYGYDQVEHQTEKQVYDAFLKESDSLEKYFSFGVVNWTRFGNEMESDLILVGKAGVFIIEIKGGRIDVRDGVYHQNGHKMDKSPLKQASDNYWSLTRVLEENGVDKYSSRLGGYLCIFSETYWDYAADAPNRNIILDCFFSHSLDSSLKKIASYYREVAVSRGWSQKPLSNDEIQKIQSILVGTTKQVSDLRQSIDINTHKFLELSQEQYERYQEISDNDRIIIKGPPGSGKTLLAYQIMKDKELAGERTFFICKNKALASYLRSKLTRELGGDLKFIKVQHIDEFARNICGDSTDTADYVEVIKQATKQIKDELVQFDKFPYLLIDEGQDILQEEYCDLVDQVVEGGLSNGKWCLLMDPNQDMFDSAQEDVFNVYFNNNATIKRLTKNYRNTDQIQKTASVLSSTEVVLTNGISGESPEIRIYKDQQDEAIKVAKDIESLIESGIKPSEITILSFVGKKFSLADKSLLKLKNGIKVIHINEKGWDSISDNEIVYASVYEFKGMDNDVIILTDINDIDSRNISKVRHLVGATRARNHYIMYVTENVMQRLLDHDNGDILTQIDPAYTRL